LWDTRNKILHGNTLEETRAREIAQLTIEITEAYDAFSKDNFLVPSSFRHLFTSKTLKQRTMKQDEDSMRCWLRSYREGVLTQNERMQQQAVAAKTFFLPRQHKGNSNSKPAGDTNLITFSHEDSTILTDDSDLSTSSETTDLGTLTSTDVSSGSSVRSIFSDRTQL